jgi:hypothetical protein
VGNFAYFALNKHFSQVEMYTSADKTKSKVDNGPGSCHLTTLSLLEMYLVVNITAQQGCKDFGVAPRVRLDAISTLGSQGVRQRYDVSAI